MNDDLLRRATHALRHETEGANLRSGLTRARVLDSATKQRAGARRFFVRWALAIASLFVVGTALARVGGQWPVVRAAVQSIAELLVPSEAAEKHRARARHARDGQRSAARPPAQDHDGPDSGATPESAPPTAATEAQAATTASRAASQAGSTLPRATSSAPGPALTQPGAATQTRADAPIVAHARQHQGLAKHATATSHAHRVATSRRNDTEHSQVDAPEPTTEQESITRQQHAAADAQRPQTAAPGDTTPLPSAASTAQPAEGMSRSSSSPPSAAGAARAESAELVLFRHAQNLHLARDPAAALAAWDAYLRVATHGVLRPEASYNRALCLIRLGRNAEARAALEPFARGAFGDYRQREARALIDALSPR